jgi:hypothetical protein
MAALTDFEGTINTARSYLGTNSAGVSAMITEMLPPATSVTNGSILLRDRRARF